MKTRLLFAVLLALSLLSVHLRPAQADGIIIPPWPCPGPECPPPCTGDDCPPQPRPMAQLDIKYHHVKVTINEQIATTRVDQVFYNPNSYAVEGTYVFPLPLDAVVSDFTLWVDGQPVEGKVLSADEARKIYEETVSQMRDPALLEYIGRGAVQANVFPIPPEGERRIELEYTQALTAENGLVRYVYPLNTEKFSAQELESVSVTVEIAASQPLRAVYSSSHPVAVSKSDEQHATVSWEDSNVLPDSDFILYYSIGESQAFHLFSYRDPGETSDADGFFLLLLAPKPGEEAQTVAKDVLLVLDHSGSMEGEKFQQAQAALRYILEHLNPEDRFHITAFSSGVETYASGLRPASEAREAIDWVDGISAAGSTDINRALLEAAEVADAERPTYLIFLTDGLPTEGVTDSADILANFSQAAGSNLRLFAFGVGYDVDTFLLDSLTQAQHGLSTYVQPGENLEESLSGFYARISTPVLTNLEIDFGGLNVYDVYPNPLPDLFSGSQVVVTGRYRQGGAFDVILRGQVNGQTETFRYEGQGFVQDSRSVRNAPVGLPRLWATRKIGYLLNEIRLKGPNTELVEQVVALSLRYGIVTPYTSYLVEEPVSLAAENRQAMATQAVDQMRSAAAAPVFGQAAVEKAAEAGAMTQADQSATVPQAAGQHLRTVGTRTFVLNEGVWLDTTYVPDQMKPVQVAFLSPDYFALARSSADLAAALALGERVVVVADGQAYEVVSADSSVPPVSIPSQPTPTPAATDQPVEPAAAGQSSVPPTASAQPVDAPAGPDMSLVAIPVVGVVSLLALALLVTRRQRDE